jgi:hypothetical protein
MIRNTRLAFFAFLLMWQAHVIHPSEAAPSLGGTGSVQAILAAHPAGGSEMVSDLTMVALTDVSSAEFIAQAYETASNGQKFAIGAALKKALLSAKSSGQSEVASQILAAVKLGGKELQESVGGDDSSDTVLSGVARIKNAHSHGALHGGDVAVSPSRP